MEEPEDEPKYEKSEKLVIIKDNSNKILPANASKKEIVKVIHDDTYEPLYNKPEKPRVQEFDKPNPWSKIIYDPTEMYPYHFYIKVKVPSLKDYEDWKKVIPNIDFNPMTKDVIIPSKDEASALAVANLMVINFSGQMTLENILEKDLLQISIAKAKSHEMVQNKLRDQINETLFGKSLYVSKPNFESDLAKNKVEDRSFDKTCTKQPYQNCDRVNFQSEHFNDTFEHFSIDSSNSTDIEAFDGSSYSYL